VSRFRLAVSAEMVFLDLPFQERARRIAELGFELWDWTTKDLDALTRTGATFSSMTGYVRGTLADPDSVVASEVVTPAMWLHAARTLTRLAELGERAGRVFTLENLIQLVERALPLVGEIQVADVPGRREPGTGEIHYPAVAAALDRLGYTGVVGLEAWASGDPVRALERFRAAFTLPAPP